MPFKESNKILTTNYKFLIMLNRRHIRIKVMQTLYAFNSTDADDISKLEKFLLKSIEDMYGLHLSILELLCELHKKAEDHRQKSLNKFLATEEDKNPNLAFIDNRILQFLRQNSLLEEEFKDEKKNFWYLNFEYVDILFKAILNSDVYKRYLSQPKNDFNTDKQFLIDLYSEVIATNDQLFELFEDKKLTWIDDFPVINTNLLKIFRKFKPSSPEKLIMPRLFKDEEDKQFAMSLIRKVALNQHKYNAEIAEKTKNWDSDRIARMDMVLLQMAICEFQEFPSIPFKVSINEYLEISKEYSTPKSSIFINGILDKIIREYNENGQHKKVGRGLL